ncbi:kinase-like protein [Penicillium angulare]|uniref:EKC/KEOPS complex subunit BUD32 n=1 Tax=Penicillium angulare TaxID=116970 RepID=A0A9W9EVH0_9EURO|nr:kinase-like protein [Penicillium angulare]
MKGFHHALSISEHIQTFPRTYKEDQGYRVDDSEPCERSENIIFHADGLKWHVKVTSKAKIGITKRAGLLKRRKKLEALISLIDFHSISLLPDTVSEIVIEKVSCLLCLPKLPLKQEFQLDYTEPSDTCWVYTIQEDASRVLYPIYDIESKLPMIALADIEEKEQISNNVFLVTSKGRDENLIYKTVEHPFYEQNHTAVFQQELRNLVLLQGCRNIVQLVAVVTSPSPFQTKPSSGSVDVILGMVLEYYPNGTLEDAIHLLNGKGTAWKTWPCHLAHALLRLHNTCITHMDITSRNVVIDAADEPVFIDIGVGYTYENLAPEFRNDFPPLELSFNQRCQNDWWAFGKLLIELASIEDNGSSGTIIRNIGEKLSCEHPEDRLDISEAIRILPTSKKLIYRNII